MRSLLWSAARVDEAIEAIARARGWLGSSEASGLESERVSLRYATIEDELPRLGSSIVALPSGGEDRALAIVNTTRRHAFVLAPGGATEAISLHLLREALCSEIDSRFGAEADRVVAASGISGRRARHARGLVLREIAGDAAIGEIRILRPPLENVRACIREARLIPKAIAFLAGNVAETLLYLASWWILGLMAFDVRSFDTLCALWLLAVSSIVPLRALQAVASRSLVIEGSAFLKRRLLLGALQLHPDEVHGKGAGTFLAHILESSAAEALGASGAFDGATSIIGAACALWVLGKGAGGMAHALLYALWLVATAVVTLAYAKARAAWTDGRFALTGRVVENMIGHKTRLAQKEPSKRNDEEDQRLDRYVAYEIVLNRRAITLDMLRRIWPWAGLLALAPAIVLGRANASAIAVAAGGVLLGSSALMKWTDASARFTAAMIAWRRVAPFWQAASRRSSTGSTALKPLLDADDGTDALPLLHASCITYRHPNREAAALDQADLILRAHDRVLVRGPSGSGKSTLASILSGVRAPQSGLLFFRGLDLASVGLENWRRRVLLVPQFHINHIFVGTLGYNLFLGRGWPPSAADLEEARAVCRGVGLGPLIDRMPLGLNQPVGETGWQLSHGERTRVFLARAILQKPAVTILDETFAALDSTTLAEFMQFVLDRSHALMVIAHVGAMEGSRDRLPPMVSVVNRRECEFGLPDPRAADRGRLQP